MLKLGISSAEADKWLQDEKAPTAFEVYGSNWPTVQVFCSISTQWRWSSGMKSFRTGLDYNVLTPTLYEVMGIPKKDRRKVFLGLQTMEMEALTVFAKSK